MKGVIFDVDGVLLDSMEVWEHLGELYLKELGITPEEHLSETLAVLSMEEGAEYLVQHYGLPSAPAQVVEEVVLLIRDAYEKWIPARKGVEEFLEGFSRKQIPLVIATSGNRENAVLALKRLGLVEYFSEIFTCTGVGKGKNQPDIYLAAADFLHAEPEEIWVFEDALHALITAGKAGFHTVGVWEKTQRGAKARIQETAEIFLECFEDFTGFWACCQQREQKDPLREREERV